MKKIYIVVFIWISIVSVLSCNKNTENRIANKIIVPNKVSDTIMLGQYYLSEIIIPNFDSLQEYSCLLGKYVIKNNNTLIMQSTYDSLPRFKKDRFRLIIKMTETGTHEINGFLRGVSNTKTIYYRIKDSVYVADTSR